MDYVTGLISCIFNIPLSYLSTRMVLEKNNNFTTIFRINNKFLYYGSKIEIVKTLISSTCYLGTYMFLRETYNKENNIYKSAFFGGCTGILCWIIIFPLDSIKIDIQTTNNNNILYHIKNRYNKFGLKNFYKGITPILLGTYIHQI